MPGRFVGDMANRYRFTLQELQLVSDMALDRSRWKEQPLVEDWPDEGDKSALIRALVRRPRTGPRPREELCGVFPGLTSREP